jgi:hypothetical protein
VHIQLDGVGAGFEGKLERRQRVLASKTGHSPMGNQLRGQGAGLLALGT